MRSTQLFRNENFIRLLRVFWESPRSQKLGWNVLDKQKHESPALDPYEGSYGLLECDRQMKVTVIGAAGRVGKTLSLLLKTCPLIDHLCLFDIDKSVKGIGVDISHIDTKCCVSYVCGMRNIQQALNSPDVVIIAAGCPASPNLSGKKLFDKNAPVVAGLSEACARFCPKACVVLITNPINSLLPVMGEVYQIITNQIPSKKMFGLTTLDVVRASTFVAEVIRKDPNNVIVPVIGGTSQETIVPVISQMKPCCKIKRGEMIALTECLKRAEDNLADCQNCGTRGSSTLSTAYAGFRFTSSLVSALRGADNIIECAFVRSNVLPELEYLASPLKLGVQGIEHNFGYPPLSDYELAGLEQSVATLQSDISMGKAFVASIGDTVQKGLIWKRLPPIPGKPIPDSDGKEFGKTVLDGEKTEQRNSRLEGDERKELNKKEASLDLVPTSLTQEVYSEGVRNWAVHSSLKQLFKRRESNCEEVVRESVPTEVDSDSYNAKPLEELLGEQPPQTQMLTLREPFNPGLLQNCHQTPQSVRGFHTCHTKLNNKYERYIREDRKKTLESMKSAVVPLPQVVKIRKGYRKTPEVFKLQPKILKNANVSARQKYRYYNNQKKSPNCSFLLVVDKGKQDSKNLGEIVCASDKTQDADEKEDEKNENMSETDENELVCVDEADEITKYKKLILEQLQQLKKENEELKKQMSALAQEKVVVTALQIQNPCVDPERTKPKSPKSWVVLTFTKFCKKLVPKRKERKKLLLLQNEEKKEKREEEEFEDSPKNSETSEKQKESDQDQQYLKFLEKLMDDQSEVRLEKTLRPNRVVK